MVGYADMTNVFKIRHGKETHVYRTENPPDKKSLLGQFRQVAEELAAKKRKEREGEHERRKSLWAGGDVSVTSLFSIKIVIRFVKACISGLERRRSGPTDP